MRFKAVGGPKMKIRRSVITSNTSPLKFENPKENKILDKKWILCMSNDFQEENLLNSFETDKKEV
jgi:hypothetical protein